MVAIIKPGKSLRNTFYYNENKVKEGKAVCLMAENFSRKLEALGENAKLKMLTKMAEQNTRAKVNSVHFTLNFAPSENLSKETFREIAKEYMEQVGFGNQPYLVYQHFDAGHPHLHIVATNIEADGKRIDLHHLGIRKSEPARKAIEKGFGLIRAEDQKQKKYKLKPVHPGKVVYGRSESKRAIYNILIHVLPAYKYKSLPELNAVLNLYNIRADRGSPNSRTYKHKGLLFHILDNKGKTIGVPIKASAFSNKPTFDFLEKQFSKKESERTKHKPHVKNAIDLFFLKNKNPSLKRLIVVLEKEGIHTVLRKNKEGLIYGITYVDHQTKCVFNGSALGKAYSAKRVQERCAEKEGFEPNLRAHSAQKTSIGLQPQANAFVAETKDNTHVIEGPLRLNKIEKEELLNILMRPEHISEYLPYQLKRKRKKKKRKAGRKSSDNQ